MHGLWTLTKPNTECTNTQWPSVADSVHHFHFQMMTTLPLTTAPMSSAMMSTPTIPPELVDIILDYAYNDLSLLTACSLVCRAWFPSARYHIFHNVSLNSQNASSFVRLLNAPLSTISHFTRRIEAKDTYEDERWLSSMFPCLSVLPALTSVSITSSFDTTFSEETLATLASFDTLVELKLAECAFEDFSQVQKLLCSFPVLEKLHLEADWPEPRQIAPTAGRPSPRLNEVYLRCESSHVLAWLITAPQVSPVSKLTLHGVDADDLPTLTRYLQILGPALTHLTIFPSGSLYGGYLQIQRLNTPRRLSKSRSQMCYAAISICQFIHPLNTSNSRLTAIVPIS